MHATSNFFLSFTQIMSFQIKNKTILLSLLYIFSISLFAQIPAGYYSAAEGKTEAALKTQLSSIVSAGAVDKGYDYLYTIYQTSDNLPNGKVWDMYSIKSNGTADYYFIHNSDKCGSYSGEGSCYNREHTFCDSWLGNSSPQRSDAHHLIPTDGYVNNRRGSLPHGKVNSATWTSSNGSKVGSSYSSTGYSGTVFEPTDEFKGDFARMYFYVATRYESKIAGWKNNGTAGEILAGNSYPAYKSWFYNLMLEWNSSDPVSDKEINRNNAIAVYQKNRNPYIDHPELADFIWGNKIGQLWSETQSTYPTIVSPKNASIIDFGSVAYMQSANQNVQISAANLTGDLTLTLTGNNAANFALSTYTITKVQAEAGYSLNVSFNAQTLGAQAANIIISGGGVSATTVILNALSTDDFLALAATNIASKGFNANWTVSATATSYLLDVFTKTVSGNGAIQTLLEADFNGSIPSEWTTKDYTDVVTDGFVRLASGSNPGEINTPAIDLSTAGKRLIVKAKRYNTDSNAELTVKVDGQELTVWITTATVQDFTVDLPIGKVNSTISLSAIKNKRVYVDNFKVETLGSTVSKVSVTGYPANVGNVLTYTVDNLESDSTYFYQVSPVGSSTAKSDEIQVKTSITTTNKALSANNTISYYTTSDGIYISKLPSNAVISVYNLLGNQLYKVQTNAAEIELKLPQQGIYLLQVINNNERSVFKVRY